MKPKFPFLFLPFLLSLFIIGSCKNGTLREKKPIVLGDTRTIVTETDTNKLLNYTEDISLRKQDESQIAKMMVQVDSLKTTQKLEKTLNEGPIVGFKIDFGDCQVVFDKLEAKELKPQDPTTSRSVSYLVTKGELSEIKIKVDGLNSISVSERIFTKLKVDNGSETLLLNALGRKISDWFNLAGKDNMYISAGPNSFQFNDLTNAKIKEAVTKELTTKNKKENETQAWMEAIKNTRNYTDAPCKIYVSSAQFRLKGTTKEGSNVSKLIQFDIIQ